MPASPLLSYGRNTKNLKKKRNFFGITDAIKMKKINFTQLICIVLSITSCNVQFFNQTMKSLPFMYLYSLPSYLFLLYNYKMFIMKLLKNPKQKEISNYNAKRNFTTVNTLGYPLYLLLCIHIYTHGKFIYIYKYM